MSLFPVSLKELYPTTVEKETATQLFYRKLCKMLQNSFFAEHFHANASVKGPLSLVFFNC